MKKSGIIFKGIGGFYYVKTDEGIYECRARGVFKKEGLVPMVGDRVNIDIMEGEDPGWGLGTSRDEEVTATLAGKAWLSEILDRDNSFIRPPVANVDCFIVMMAAAEPEPNLPLIDRFLVMAEQYQTKAILAINKCELVSEKFLNELVSMYKPVYPLVLMNAKKDDGIEDLKKAILELKLESGKDEFTVALSGPSGVGKSTTINALQKSLVMETGEISDKTRRGRHTTRHAEIFETDFGVNVFDTPGFSSFEILDADEDKLEHYYPEFAYYLGKCKYDNCRHYKEPDCAIRQAVRDGEISKSRYLSYKGQLAEIRDRELNKY